MVAASEVKQQCPVEFLDPAGPLHGQAIAKVGHPLRVLVQGCSLISLEPAGGQTVDRHAVSAAPSSPCDSPTAHQVRS